MVVVSLVSEHDTGGRCDVFFGTRRGGESSEMKGGFMRALAWQAYGWGQGVMKRTGGMGFESACVD